LKLPIGSFFVGLVDGVIWRAQNNRNSFKTLVSLSLAKVTMSNVYLIHLRGLKSLEKLYLNDTQIGDEGITHLVALKKTLKVLDLTGNEHITNQSFENLRFLEKLDELYLTRTAITMNGLRMFVKDTKSKSNLLFVERRNLQKKKGKYKRKNTYRSSFCRTKKPTEEKKKYLPIFFL
jgi:pSer/pThr/pTyr-binding forkhead associated (FHA) protein